MARSIEISNSDDVIDFRDVIERIEQLEELEQPGSVDTGNPDDADQDQDTLFAELATLRALAEECKGNGGDEQWRGDWYPITLIRDSYFRDYAEELADDIGAIDKDASWPCNFIDWDRAANALQQDYTSVEFDGVTYWVR